MRHFLFAYIFLLTFGGCQKNSEASPQSEQSKRWIQIITKLPDQQNQQAVRTKIEQNPEKYADKIIVTRNPATYQLAVGIFSSSDYTAASLKYESEVHNITVAHGKEHKLKIKLYPTISIDSITHNEKEPAPVPDQPSPSPTAASSDDRLYNNHNKDDWFTIYESTNCTALTFYKIPKDSTSQTYPVTVYAINQYASSSPCPSQITLTIDSSTIKPLSPNSQRASCVYKINDESSITIFGVYGSRNIGGIAIETQDRTISIKCDNPTKNHAFFRES